MVSHTLSSAAARRRSQAKAGLIATPRDVIAESEKQWIYTDQELLRSPSILDGMPVKQEQELRFKGAFFIAQAGNSLRLPHTAITVATILFQRFLMRQSLVENPATNRRPLHHYQISAIALYVASKAEEKLPRLKDFIVQVCRVGEKKPNLVVDEQDKVFWRWRDSILLNENLFLETVCFDLNIETPQQFLSPLLKLYNIYPPTDSKSNSIRKASWAFLSDAGASQACLLFTPQTMAATALYICALRFEMSFEDDEKGRPWWRQHGVSYADIQRACEYMANMYESRKGHAQEFGLYASRLSTPNERTDKTRQRRFEKTPSPSPEPSPAPSSSVTAASPVRSAYSSPMHSRETEYGGGNNVSHSLPQKRSHAEYVRDVRSRSPPTRSQAGSGFARSPVGSHLTSSSGYYGTHSSNSHHHSYRHPDHSNNYHHHHQSSSSIYNSKNGDYHQNHKYPSHLPPPPDLRPPGTHLHDRRRSSFSQDQDRDRDRGHDRVREPDRDWDRSRRDKSRELPDRSYGDYVDTRTYKRARTEDRDEVIGQHGSGDGYHGGAGAGAGAGAGVRRGDITEPADSRTRAQNGGGAGGNKRGYHESRHRYEGSSPLQRPTSQGNGAVDRGRDGGGGGGAGATAAPDDESEEGEVSEEGELEG